jgi:hypothetical protein
MMFRKIQVRAPLALAATIALAGCATTAAISDISDSKVSVQSNKQELDATIISEAERGCSQYDKRPVHLSIRCSVFNQGVCMAYDHLFSCTDN